MKTILRFCSILICLPLLASDGGNTLPRVSAVMKKAVETHQVSGVVTVVATKDRILHCEALGLADIAKNEPMTTDTLFWIASMTKPVTAVALLMLQDEGKLKVTDPVSKFIPEFSGLRTPSDKPANLTIAQIMTHVSGLGEASREAAAEAKTLSDLIPLFLAAPMQFEPGSKWSYCQSAINTGSRIVEIASGIPFDVFVQKRILDPLGMKHTTFYPTKMPATHRAVGYKINPATSQLEMAQTPSGFGAEGHPPVGNGGLFSTGPDYARFCQMLLGQGMFEGKRYLRPESFRLMSTVQTGDMPTGFFQAPEFGGHGTNYGWGIGTCILRSPHNGVASMLSAGTFGHGGAWGTQAWVDPVRGTAYILMIQRSDFRNSDASDIRREFQEAAAGPR